MKRALLLAGLAILLLPACSGAQARTPVVRRMPEAPSQPQGEARDACRRRQRSLLRLDELRWQREGAASKWSSADRTVRLCETLRNRIRQGQQVPYVVDGSEMLRRPSGEDLADAITTALWTEPLDPAERTEFIREMVRGYLFQSRFVDEVLQGYLEDLTDRRDMAQAEMALLDDQIEKLDTQVAQLEPVVEEDGRWAEMLIEATIFHGPACLHPLYAEALEIQRGQRAVETRRGERSVETPRTERAVETPRGERPPPPPAVARSALRIYRGNFVTDSPEAAKLTSIPGPLTLTVDPEKGTAVFASGVSYTGQGSIGSPGSRDRTQLRSTCRVSLNPGRVDASGSAQGTYVAAIVLTRVGSSRPPGKLTMQGFWQAEPAPGSGGKVYELYWWGVQEKRRNLVYRLRLVEK